MLSGLIADGSHHCMDSGYWQLRHEGYQLTLAPSADTITGYRTGHPERSYAQVLAGVPSRVGKDARAERRSALTPASPLGTGPVLDDIEAVRGIDVSKLHLTAGACSAYERLQSIRWDLSDLEFLDAFRDALKVDLTGAEVLLGERRHMVATPERVWRISVDGHSVLGVDPNLQPTNADATPVESTPVSQLPHHDHEGPMTATTALPLSASTGSLHDILAERVRTARSDRMHEALRHRLLADLFETDYDTGSDELADGWCLLPDGMALYEVLGENGQQYTHIREAVLHVQEVEYLRGAPRAEHIVIVLPAAPTEAWITDAVSGSFGVTLVWRDGRDWAGPGAALVSPDS
jgi:hypothetical protein